MTLLCSCLNKNRHTVVSGDLDWTRTSMRITCSAVSRKHLPVTCPSLIYLLSTIFLPSRERQHVYLLLSIYQPTYHLSLSAYSYLSLSICLSLVLIIYLFQGVHYNYSHTNPRSGDWACLELLPSLNVVACKDIVTRRELADSTALCCVRETLLRLGELVILWSQSGWPEHSCTVLNPEWLSIEMRFQKLV